MKALVFERPGKATVMEVDDPQVGPNEVLIKVAACGLCGTDLRAYMGKWPLSFPYVPGHEFSGTVAALGKSVNDLEIGQPVAVIPGLYCGHCRFCHESRFNFCQNRQLYGGQLPGGFAEYVSVQRKVVYACEGVSLEEAAIIEPVACGVHAFKRLGYCLGSRVLLFGCGSQGLILIQLSKLHGASSVTAVDLYDKKLDMARSLGADRVFKADAQLDEALRDQGPYDLVIDATGVPRVMQDMFQYVDKGGKLVFFGVCPPDARIEISPFQVFRDELKIFGTYSSSVDFEEALRLVQSDVVDVRSIITHSFPLEEFTAALEMIKHPADSGKILIKPE